MVDYLGNLEVGGRNRNGYGFRTGWVVICMGFMLVWGFWKLVYVGWVEGGGLFYLEGVVLGVSQYYLYIHMYVVGKEREW
jgi:hypothetical protein